MKKTKKNRSIRSILLKFVENNGPQPYSKLHEIVLTVAGQPLTRHDYGSSYLDYVSKYSSVCFPVRGERRYLVKKDDGLYHLEYYGGEF